MFWLSCAFVTLFSVPKEDCREGVYRAAQSKMYPAAMNAAVAAAAANRHPVSTQL